MLSAIDSLCHWSVSIGPLSQLTTVVYVSQNPAFLVSRRIVVCRMRHHVAVTVDLMFRVFMMLRNVIVDVTISDCARISGTVSVPCNDAK